MSNSHGQPSVSTDSESENSERTGSDPDTAPQRSTAELKQEADRSDHVTVIDGALACAHCERRFPAAESIYSVTGHLSSNNCPEYTPHDQVNRTKAFPGPFEPATVPDTTEPTELGRTLGIENIDDEDAQRRALEAQREVETLFEEYDSLLRFGIERARAEAGPESRIAQLLPTTTEQGDYRGPFSTIPEWKVGAIGATLGVTSAISPMPFSTFAGVALLGLGFAGGKGQRLTEIHEESTSFLIGLFLSFVVGLLVLFATGMPIPGPSISL